MRLACPNCAAEFTVPAGALSDKPRQVRCSKCNHQWQVTSKDALDDGAITDPNLAKPQAFDMSAQGGAPISKIPDNNIMNNTPPLNTNMGANMGANMVGNNDAMMNDELQKSEPSLKDEALMENSGVESVISKRNARIMWSSYFILVILLAAGFVLSNSLITEYYPGATYYYSMIGITKQSVGHGLVISEPTIESEQNGNVKVYVAKGLIKNSTNDEMVVPAIRGGFKTKNGEYLPAPKWYFKPDDTIIAPGSSIAYYTQFTEVPSNAHTLVFVFVTDIEAEKGI